MTTPPRKLRPTLLNTLVPTLAIIVVAVTASLLVREKVETGADSNSTDIHSDQAGVVEVGGTFPDFELPDLQGKKHRVTQSESKILVINLWATWCEACMVEMPSLQKLDDQLGAEGIHVVTISMDEDYATEVPPVVKRLGLRVPVYVDPEQKVGNDLQVDVIPVTYVINRASRKILAMESGERDWAAAEMVEKLRAMAANLK